MRVLCITTILLHIKTKKCIHISKKCTPLLGDELKKSVHNTIVTAIQNDQPSNVPSHTEPKQEELRGAFFQLIVTHTSYTQTARPEGKYTQKKLAFSMHFWVTHESLNCVSHTIRRHAMHTGWISNSLYSDRTRHRTLKKIRCKVFGVASVEILPLFAGWVTMSGFFSTLVDMRMEYSVCGFRKRRKNCLAYVFSGYGWVIWKSLCSCE